METKLVILFCLVIFSLINNLESKREKKKEIYSLNDTDIDNNWSDFKRNHSKSFRNSSDERRRREIFKNSLKIINEQNEKYNNGTSDFTFGINRFSDMTPEEFAAFVNNSGVNIHNIPKNGTKYVPNTGRQSLPSSIDWRNMSGKSYVSPIRNQGGCGSCWAFSAISSLESYYFKTNGELLSLSEQQQVDCVYLSQGYTGTNADGCLGGWMSYVFDYTKTNGIALSTSYPYTSGTTGNWSGTCKSVTKSPVQVTGYISVTNGVASESLVTSALANQGPLSVALYASTKFQYYSSGVFTDTTCPNGEVNHAVNLVGYGTLDGQDYYILRNSWGTDWGLNGYMYYKRDTVGNSNQCMIASYTSYPTIKASSSVTTTPAKPATTTIKPITTTVRPTTTTIKPITTTVRPATTTIKPITTTVRPATTTTKPKTTTIKPITTTFKPKTTTKKKFSGK